jgi:uncharacterized membrane protein YbhN (UPF0104 family)
VKANAFRQVSRKNVFLLLIVVTGLYVLAPRMGSFKNSLPAVANADYAYIGLGILAWLSTFFTSALVYKFIALKPLKYHRTLLVQLASGFTNRLVPAGIGTLTLNISYLSKSGHTAVQAASLAALNNFLGFAGNVFLLLIALAISPVYINNGLHIHIHRSTLIAVAILGLLVLLVIFKKAGSRILKAIKNAVGLITRNIIKKPSYFLAALVASMAVTCGYTLSLYSVGLALNVHISFAQTLLALTLGVAVATITPTPGGLGGAEAGLVAALISLGVASHQALAMVLTYRLIVYWLPIVPGFICLQLALRRRYV